MQCIDDILQEKQRSAKFNENELKLLYTLIKKYKHLILNRKTGQVTPKQKEEAWQALTIEFNNDPACSLNRSVTQLKNRWDYMKRNAKKDRAAIKKIHQFGGKKEPALLDETGAVSDTVREPVAVPSTFDCDSKMVVLNNETIEIFSTPVTVTIPEEPFEDATKASCEPILGTQNTNHNTDDASVKNLSDLCTSFLQMKKRKLHVNDTPFVKSEPQYRSKSVEVADKKMKCLNEREFNKNKRNSLELEILEKKSENASLERKKLELECDAQNLEIQIKRLIKKKVELELALLEKQFNK